MREHASGLQNCVSVSRGPSSSLLGIFTWKKKRRGMSAARAWHASSLRSCSFPQKAFPVLPDGFSNFKLPDRRGERVLVEGNYSMAERWWLEML
jgi:hypothetical protein